MDSDNAWRLEVVYVSIAGDIEAEVNWYEGLGMESNLLYLIK